MPSRSDEELALALQQGDESAFEELVHRHQGRVFAVAYRITGDREDALDVTQEAFLKAYRKIDAWKCPYHNSRACLEMIYRINEMLI